MIHNGKHFLVLLISYFSRTRAGIRNDTFCYPDRIRLPAYDRDRGRLR